MLIANGMVFCEDGEFHTTNLTVDGSRITGLGSRKNNPDGRILDAKNCYVVPGFVDIHIHGAMGADFSDGTTAATDIMAKYLLSMGVTSFLGTSMALPEERLTPIFETARPLISVTRPGFSVLRGINMEGPFFNVEKRGAQNPEYILPPDFEMFSRLYAASGQGIRTVAVAPETEGGLEFVEKAGRICSVSLGHTCADFDTAQKALNAGADHITHLFNGMPPFHHRDPGVVGAAIESEAFIELICDGVHIHPSTVRSIFRMFGDDRVCLISDAMRACGMPDGKYDLGGQTVTVENGAATIHTGSLAGSITVLSDCFRKAVTFGIPLESALKAATINPARSVGLDREIGSLAPGKCADILILGRDLSIKKIICCGRDVPQR